MPLRYHSPPTALRLGLNSSQLLHRRASLQLLVCHRHGRPFHSTPPLRDDEIDRSTNHYETLKLVPGATVAEIKKSFYALSKTHHPDHNPSDPHASRRFMRISEAYSTLSSPEKRTKYDRDVLGLHRLQHQADRRGSYSSTTANPAGGRPATGLSRRRGTFTGPPPSFYRSGGWGAHSAKRSAAHEDSTGSGGGAASARAGPKDHHNDGAWATAGGQFGGGAGGMGPGQDPFGHQESVPHFDKESHERTGRKVAERRMQRMRVDGREIDVDSERGQGGMFLVIGGVLVLSCLAPLAVSQLWMAGDGKKTKDWDKNVKG